MLLSNGKGHTDAGDTVNDQASSDRMLIVSSDGHIGPPAERYREYFEPSFRGEFDRWFSEYVPRWMTKGTQAGGSVKVLAPKREPREPKGKNALAALGKKPKAKGESKPAEGEQKAAEGEQNEAGA